MLIIGHNYELLSQIYAIRKVKIMMYDVRLFTNSLKILTHWVKIMKKEKLYWPASCRKLFLTLSFLVTYSTWGGQMTSITNICNNVTKTWTLWASGRNTWQWFLSLLNFQLQSNVSVWLYKTQACLVCCFTGLWSVVEMRSAVKHCVALPWMLEQISCSIGPGPPTPGGQPVSRPGPWVKGPNP